MLSVKPPVGAKYELLEAQLEDGKTRRPSCNDPSSTMTLVWMILTFIFASLWAVSLLNHYNHKNWSYEFGFKTDFAAARPALELEEVRFTSGVYIDSNGTFHLQDHPGIPKYVGPPSPEIDQAWDDIVEPEWFHATEDEVVHYGGEDLAKKLSRGENGLYSAQLDVFHSLHCLNQIRKGIDREYYYPSYGPRNDTFVNYKHWDHCIDQLRQVLQCHSDITMNGAIYYESANKAFVDTEDVHTCRNFTKLREWFDERIRSGARLV